VRLLRDCPHPGELTDYGDVSYTPQRL
jgi:hypothetical protein